LITVESAPSPWRVIDLLRVRLEVQEHVPEGIATVSPADALAYAADTSAEEQEEALIVAADEGEGKMIINNANTSKRYLRRMMLPPARLRSDWPARPVGHRIFLDLPFLSCSATRAKLCNHYAIKTKSIQYVKSY
jgi:hypothetical protein